MTIDPTTNETRVLRRLVEGGDPPCPRAEGLELAQLYVHGLIDIVKVYKPSPRGIDALRQIDGAARG